MAEEADGQPFCLGAAHGSAAAHAGDVRQGEPSVHQLIVSDVEGVCNGQV